jgi:hypothetical protein
LPLGLGVFCTLSSSALGGESPDSARAPERVERPETVRRGATTTYAHALANASTLHGRCGVSTNGCSHFRPGVDAFGWLACPVGNDPCAGVGASWTGTTAEKKKVVDDALSALVSVHRDRVDARAPTVLVGFSQGAWTALELVRASGAPETRFVSLGAVGHTYVGENEAPLRGGARVAGGAGARRTLHDAAGIERSRRKGMTR